MSLAATLDALLKPLESQPMGPGQPQTITCDTPQGPLRVELTAVSPLACAVNSLELVTSVTQGWDASQLKTLSERLAHRLRYLLEPISAVELDQEAAILQMRSHPPARDEQEGRVYYELTVQPGHLRLQRFRKAAGQPRTPIPMTFTREVLGRLASDLVAVQ